MITSQKKSFRSKLLTRCGIGGLVLFVLAGACGAYLFADGRKIDPRSTPKTAKVTSPVGVGALGRLEPGWKVFQVAPAASLERSRVESLLVNEGDELASGALMAVLDTNKIRKAALNEAQAQVMVCRAKLALVKSGSKAEEIAAQEATVDQLKASLRRSESEFKRAEWMSRSGALAPEDFDQKQTQMQIAKATLKQSEATLAALKVVRPEDVLVAQAELAKAEAGVAKAEADLDMTVIKAPIAGRVLKIHARAGEKIGDDGLLEIGDTHYMHAVAEVYEKDVSQIKIGQRAIVRLQSLDADLVGEVVHVGWKVGRKVVLDNDPVKDTDARVVEVRVKLDGAGSAKVAGLSYARVQVRIETISPQ